MATKLEEPYVMTLKWSNRCYKLTFVLNGWIILTDIINIYKYTYSYFICGIYEQNKSEKGKQR